MRYLYVCNTSSDSISKISMDPFMITDTLSLCSNSFDRIGPHDICCYGNKLLIANNYSNSIIMVDSNDFEINKEFFIGIHCNGVRVWNDKAYVICGELNCIIVFDLIREKIIEEIPCGNLPHSIDIDYDNGKLVVSNMESNTITVMNLYNNEIKNIRVGNYPTKAIFTDYGNFILVCESNLGQDSRGNIAVLSSDEFQNIKNIKVGRAPVDIFCSKDICLTSNFGEGTLSVLDLKYLREIKRIKLGGMPRGLIKYDNYIYVGDNYNNLLFKIHINFENRSVLKVGKEPTALILS